MNNPEKQDLNRRELMFATRRFTFAILSILPTFAFGTDSAFDLVTQGMECVLINGVSVIENGKMAGPLPGMYCQERVMYRRMALAQNR